MLARIHCEQFRLKSLDFHRGLNVVLGDEGATNSIGKSSALLVVDFAFGGSDLVVKRPDLVENVGHHAYIFVFEFADRQYAFRRTTAAPDSIEQLATSTQPQQALKLDEYTNRLGALYGVSDEFASFRSVVSPYTRVWRRETCDEKRPFAAAALQPARLAVQNLLKLFKRYGAIDALVGDLAAAKSSLEAFTKAQTEHHVPKVGAREYRAHQAAVQSIGDQLAEVREHLSRYAMSAATLMSAEVLDIKRQLDMLGAQTTGLRARAQRLRSDLATATKRDTADFSPLVEYFPNVNQNRLQKVSAFHNGMNKLLRAEIRTALAEVDAQVATLESDYAALGSRLSEKLEPMPDAGRVVDRIVKLTTDLNDAITKSGAYEKLKVLRESKQAATQRLNDESASTLSHLESELNADIAALWARVYDPGRALPRLQLVPWKYQFNVPTDTGTGTAFAALLVLDISVLRASQLPYIVHDSLLFKNVEDHAVVGIVDEYEREQTKQVFISIDQIRKYGRKTADVLELRTVLKLDAGRLLYDVDWRDE